MAILTTAEVKAAYARHRRSEVSFLAKTAGTILVEASAASETRRKQGIIFDIFLSHASKDAEIILGLKKILEEQGKSVYIDWIEDPQLDRSNVTPSTADILRERMKACKSLFFVDTTGSITSQWMPWECGFFDGNKKGRVAIVPIRDSAATDYAGREFLGLYPYVTFEPPYIWIRRSLQLWTLFDLWLNGTEPAKH